MISEQAIQIQKELYLYYIDYEKAFNEACHKDLFQLLEKL